MYDDDDDTRDFEIDCSPTPYSFFCVVIMLRIPIIYILHFLCNNVVIGHFR